MNVGRIMNRDIRTCSASSSLEDAVRILWDKDCGCVPVIDEKGCVVGMLTDRDICIAAWRRGSALAHITVASVMSTPVHSCNPLDSIESAEETMKRERIRRLPVVGTDKRLIGLLSLSDIARAWSPSKHAISAESVADTLSKLSQLQHKAQRGLEWASLATPKQRPKARVGLVGR